MDQIIRRPDCALYIATKQKHPDIQSVSQLVSQSVRHLLDLTESDDVSCKNVEERLVES